MSSRWKGKSDGEAKKKQKKESSRREPLYVGRDRRLKIRGLQINRCAKSLLSIALPIVSLAFVEYRYRLLHDTM
jgi:hypothetical protein